MPARLIPYRDRLEQWMQSQDPLLPETESSRQAARQVQRTERIEFLKEVAVDDRLYEHYYTKFAQEDPGFVEAMDRYTERLILDLLAVLEVPRVRH